MIAKIASVSELFNSSDKDTVYLTKFNLLYQYGYLTYCEFAKKWPRIGKMFKDKSFASNGCVAFFSEYGRVLVFTNQDSQLESCEEIKQWIEKIDAYFTTTPDTYRVDMNPLILALPKSLVLQIENVFANSDKKFEIYY